MAQAVKVHNIGLKAPKNVCDARSEKNWESVFFQRGCLLVW
jgi:hypothetical protein